MSAPAKETLKHYHRILKFRNNGQATLNNKLKHKIYFLYYFSNVSTAATMYIRYRNIIFCAWQHTHNCAQTF